MKDFRIPLDRPKYVSFNRPSGKGGRNLPCLARFPANGANQSQSRRTGHRSQGKIMVADGRILLVRLYPITPARLSCHWPRGFCV